MENSIKTSMNTCSKYEYYKHSGSFTPIGLSIALVIGVMGTVILSLIYSYANCYIEFLYLHVLLIIAYGFCVGLLAGMAGIVGKIRNTFIIGLISFLIGLFAEYCQWVFWIFIESRGEILILDPVKIYYIMKFPETSDIGNINILTLKSALFYILCLIDAAIIIGASAFVATFIIKTKPFCEKCDKWVGKNENLALLDFVDDIEGLKLRLEQGDFAVLTLLGKAEKGSLQFTKVTLKHCRKCKDFYLISVSSVNITRNRRGRIKADEKKVVEHMIIDQQVYNYLMDWNRS